MKAAHPLIGRRLRGRYDVLRHLGSGAMSDVYLVSDRKQPGSRLALKALKPSLSNHGDLSRRFRDEGAMMFGLDHPGIVKVEAAFEEAAALYMVLAYVEGRSLEQHLAARGAMPVGEALVLFKAVLDALDYAHRHFVVHRDLKPSNVMLDARGRPLICDFGIAKQMGRPGLTAIGTTLGTPHYMSPEQVFAPQSIDHRSDIYSAGIVLYEMLTGKVPFGDDGKQTDNEVLVMHRDVAPPDPRRFAPHLQPGLVDILLRSLAKDRGQRMQGGMEFRQAIEQFEQGRYVVAPMSPSKSSGPVRPSGSGTTAVAVATRYAVYSRHDRDVVAVKVGPCGPAMVLGPFWMLAAGLPARALVCFAAVGAVLAMSALLGSQYAWAQVAGVEIVLLLCALAAWVMPAWRCNEWREQGLRREGYRPVAEIEASNAALAIAQATAPRLA